MDWLIKFHKNHENAMIKKTKKKREHKNPMNTSNGDIDKFVGNSREYNIWNFVGFYCIFIVM